MHVITGLELGGAQAMLARLVAGMDKSRFRNEVVALSGRGPAAAMIEAAGVPVHALGIGRGGGDIIAVARLIRLMRATRPDLVQTWLYHADLLGLIVSWLAGRPPILWNLRCSDIDLDQYPSSTRLVLRMLVGLSSRPTAVLVNSMAGLEQHRRLGYRPRRWELVANGVDAERFRPDPTASGRLRDELGFGPDSVLVGLVARRDPMKDHEGFLAAASRIAAARPSIRFVLVGAGVEGLAKSVAAHGLGSRVQLVGERQDIDSVLAGLDILCLASAFGEGFSNVLVEAMAAGVPCISTDVGDAATIIDGCGIVVPRRAPAAMAGAVIDLFDRGREARAALGAKARARVVDRYSLVKAVERYQAIYEASLD